MIPYDLEKRPLEKRLLQRKNRFNKSNCIFLTITSIEKNESKPT